MPHASQKNSARGGVNGRQRGQHVDAATHSAFRDKDSEHTTSLVASPRPARRTSRARGASAGSAAAFTPPSPPLRNAFARSGPLREEAVHGVSGSSSRMSGSDDDASEVLSSGGASSVLSNAMYRHRGTSSRNSSAGGGVARSTAHHQLQQQHHHSYTSDTSRRSVSSSLVSSVGAHRAPAPPRWSNTGHHSSDHAARRRPARRLATPPEELSFDSQADTSSGASSFAATPRSSRGSFSSYEEDARGRNSAAAADDEEDDRSGGLVYRPPAHRDYRMATARHAQNDPLRREEGEEEEGPSVQRRSAADPHHYSSGSRGGSVSQSLSASYPAVAADVSHPRAPNACRNSTPATAAAPAPTAHTRTTTGTPTYNIIASVTRSTFLPARAGATRRTGSSSESSGSGGGVAQHKHRGRGKSSPSPSSASTPVQRAGRRSGRSSSPPPSTAPTVPEELRHRRDRRQEGRSGRRHNRQHHHHIAASQHGGEDDGTDVLSNASAAAAAGHRGTTAPLSRCPVITWRSPARVCAITSVPSGQVLTGGDASGVIDVWDRRTGRRLCGLSGHQAPVLSLLPIPRTSLLLSGGVDRTARVWELRTLQNTLVLEGHRGIITALEALWMPDVGLNLFTGSDDGTVRQWRAATGACVHVYQGHRGPVNVVAALRPVKYIATGAGDGLFKVWNVQTLRCLSSTAAVPSRGASTATTTTAARMRSVGEMTTASSPGAVWDIVQLHDADDAIVTATDDGAVRFWSSQGTQHTLLLKELHLPGVLLRARSAARCLLVCGVHLFVGGARGELYVWDTSVLPYVGAVQGHHRGSAALEPAPQLPHGGSAANSITGSSSSSNTTTAAAAAAAAAPATAHRVLTASQAHSCGGKHSPVLGFAAASPAGGGGGVVPGGGVGDGVGDSDEPTELYEATFLFHTAAITGLTRQGAVLCSSSLDHTVCRWDLNDLIPTAAVATLNDNGEGFFATRPAFLLEDGWSMPVPPSAMAMSGVPHAAPFGGWGSVGEAGMLGGAAASLGWSGGGGMGAGGEAIPGVPLWPTSDVGGSGGEALGVRQQQQEQQQQQQLQQQEEHSLQSAVTAPFASPLALLRNPKGMMDTDAAAAVDRSGAAALFAELSPAEAAAAYTELPLTFLLEHLRSAAVSPVDLRSVATALLWILFSCLFVIFYAMCLAPLVLQGGDITNGIFAQTATYPLPSFARPNTFASVTSPALLERWLMLMMGQMNSLSAPVQLLMARRHEIVHGGSPAGSGSSNSGSVSGSDDVTGGGADALRARTQHGREAAPLAENPFGDDDISNSETSESESSESSSSGSSRRRDPVSLPSTATPTTELLTLPALPGGVVVLRHVRLRVKHVTNHSCTWNRHFLRGSAANSSLGRVCYGELTSSTESRETLCPAAAAETSTATSLLNTMNVTPLHVGCLAHTPRGASVAFNGLFYNYDSSGYMFNLPLYENSLGGPDLLYQPLKVVQQLRLLDEQRTRLVDATLFTYHISTQVFVRLHYAVEIPRGGTWMPSTDTMPCPLFLSSSGFRGKLTMGCVVVMLVLLLLGLSLQLYDAVMAYYVGKLLCHFLSLTTLVDVSVISCGLCVVGYTFRWIAVSYAVDANVLLRASIAPSTSASAGQLHGLRNAPEIYTRQIETLNDVAAAFGGLATSAAVEAVLLFLTVAMTVGRLFPFIQVIEKAMRELRVQLAAATTMLLLLVFAFSLAFHVLFGTRYYAFATVRLSLWHLMLYSAASQSVTSDVSPPLMLDRPITGKILLFIVNYIGRMLFYVYVVSIVIERVQAVARITPHISLRATLAKWWYDVQYQMALTRQRGPDVGTGGGGAAAAATSAASTNTAAAAAPGATADEDRRGHRRRANEGKADGDGDGKQKPHTALAASLTTSGHRRVVIEHVWRRLRRLQHEQAAALLHQKRAGLSASSASGHARDGESEGLSGGGQASFATISHFLQRQADVVSNMEGHGAAAAAGGTDGRVRGRQGQSEGRGSRTSSPTHAAEASTTAAAITTTTTINASYTQSETLSGLHDLHAPVEASLAHVRLRLTDLLLLLSEEEQTPFARNVIRHAWDTLAWMYHFHQQHALQQNPEERRRRLRLESGIHAARLRLEPLLAVVSATQARLEAHEARLRPLAKAVVAVAAGEH